MPKLLESVHVGTTVATEYILNAYSMEMIKYSKRKI